MFSIYPGYLCILWGILAFGEMTALKMNVFCAKIPPCIVCRESLYRPSTNLYLRICHATYDTIEIGYSMVHDM